ncbi:MAG: ABC transporter ATP-binding protein [Proteobacteria bacterium]|nr:ABC transporter ATP-binding protein [Pseudomonadota bacterium]
MTQSSPQRHLQSRTLSFHSVCVEFGKRRVLDDVSFEVNPGEIVGLVGHNGSGKTTLVRLATRVLAPLSGSVALGGRPIGEFSRAELARSLATVPQDTTLPYPFTALEVVLMGRAPHQPLLGLDRPSDIALARSVLERLDIQDLAEQSILTLSGGGRQLVRFARALAQELQQQVEEEEVRRRRGTEGFASPALRTVLREFDGLRRSLSSNADPRIILELAALRLQQLKGVGELA